MNHLSHPNERLKNDRLLSTALQTQGLHNSPHEAVYGDCEHKHKYSYTAPASGTHSMSDSTQLDNRPLKDIGILDFLARDSRPTFILDVDQAHISYRNRALDSHLRTQQTSQRVFEAWALSTAFTSISTPSLFCGRAWTLVALYKKWTVVSATCTSTSQQTQTAPSLEPHAVLSSSSSPSPIPSPSLSPSQSQAQSSSNLSSSTSAISATSPLLRLDPTSRAVSAGWTASGRRHSNVSSSSSWLTVSEENGMPQSLDWTRTSLSLISPNAQLIRSVAWQSTSIGAIDSWPDSLRQLVLAIVSNSEPRILLWGAHHHMIYNDACNVVFGSKHPSAMGERAEEIWPESWPALLPLVRRAEREGKSTKVSHMPLDMNRHAFLEETHWTLQLVPIIAHGQVVGVLDEFNEITDLVVQERRREAVTKINRTMAHVTSLPELWSEFLRGIESCREDISYAMLYVSPNASRNESSDPASPAGRQYLLQGTVGIPTGHPSALSMIDLSPSHTAQGNLLGACKQAWSSGEDVVLAAKDDTLPASLALSVPERAGGEKVVTVCVLPIPDMFGGQQFGFLVLGMTSKRPYDAEAALYVHFLRDIVTKTASAIFLPEEQRRVRQRFEEIESSLEQRLRATTLESEQVQRRFARMSQIAPVGMFAISPSNEIVFFNDAYTSIIGMSREDIESSATNPRDALHPDDEARVYATWIQCLEDKQPFTIEYRVKKPWTHTDPISGEELTLDTWVLASTTPELDDEGNIVHIQGWLLDISDRKIHEQQRLKRLHEEHAEARFTRLAETAPLGMYLLHVDGRPIYLNDAYFDLLGFTRSDFEEAVTRGAGWNDRIADEDRERVSEAWRALVEDGIPLNLEYRIKKPWKAYDTATGTEMSGPTWLQGTAVAEMDEDGNPVAVQGFVTEISMKKFSERLLAERLDEALETKRQADRFIDMTSHEMRNPLSAILQSADGILSALDSSDVSSLSDSIMETVVDSAQTIVLCAQHQKRIVDDILTLSKLDSNLLVISPDKVSPPALLGKSLKMYDAELERANITASLILESSYKQLAVGNVMLDSSRLLQVVINLLTNAIKFTQYCDRRTIKVYLGASKTQPTHNAHTASFIAPRPNRIDHTSTAEWGRGEEIYLQIAVEDSGRGLTEDELKLLFHRFSQASPKTYKQYGGSGLGLFISRELTELQGGQIGVASQVGKGSTFSFYVKARRCIDDQPFPTSETRIPTPTLVSSPVTYARRKSIASGKNDILPDCNDTNGTRNSGCTPVRRTSTALELPDLQASPLLHVLVVEDNLVNQRVMAQQLKRLGCVVHVANHGAEALEFLRGTHFWNCSKELHIASLEPPSAGTSQKPFPAAVPLSVILMDLEMPVLGGLGCVKQIRELQRGGQLVAHVPVIAVTANARSEQIATAIDYGMDSVVTKPFRIPELVPQMHELVARLRAEEETMRCH